MIEYVKGALMELTPTDAVVETAGGVAYSLSITLPTYTVLEEALSAHATVKLLCHEVIREDAWLLYGFTEERERALFRLPYRSKRSRGVDRTHNAVVDSCG